jgi:hypothetical protein
LLRLDRLRLVTARLFESHRVNRLVGFIILTSTIQFLLVETCRQKVAVCLDIFFIGILDIK